MNLLKLLHVLFSGARACCRAIKKFTKPSEIRKIKSMDFSKRCGTLLILHKVERSEDTKMSFNLNMSIESQSGITDAQILTELVRSQGPSD